MKTYYIKSVISGNILPYSVLDIEVFKAPPGYTVVGEQPEVEKVPGLGLNPYFMNYYNSNAGDASGLGGSYSFKNPYPKPNPELEIEDREKMKENGYKKLRSILIGDNFGYNPGLPYAHVAKEVEQKAEEEVKDMKSKYNKYHHWSTMEEMYSSSSFADLSKAIKDSFISLGKEQINSQEKTEDMVTKKKVSRRDIFKKNIEKVVRSTQSIVDEDTHYSSNIAETGGIKHDKYPGRTTGRSIFHNNSDQKKEGFMMGIDKLKKGIKKKSDKDYFSHLVQENDIDGGEIIKPYNLDSLQPFDSGEDEVTEETKEKQPNVATESTLNNW